VNSPLHAAQPPPPDWPALPPLPLLLPHPRSCAPRATPESRRAVARSGYEAGIRPRTASAASISRPAYSGARPAGLDDHERRHRVERRYCARARRKTDQRRRPAPGRRFDSGQSTGDRPGRRAKGHPLVINIAGAPDITEQGYKFVYRNFPTAADADPWTVSWRKRRSSTSSQRRRRQWSSCASTIPSAPPCRKASPR